MHPQTKKEIEEKAARAAYLIFKYLNNTLEEAEDAELAAWMVENEQNWKLFEEFTGEKFKRKLADLKSGTKN
jgi:hypothetical protein